MTLILLPLYKAKSFVYSMGEIKRLHGLAIRRKTFGGSHLMLFLQYGLHQDSPEIFQ